MGRRDEAVDYYRRVQEHQEFEDCHEAAEEYLRSPYQPEP